MTHHDKETRDKGTVSKEITDAQAGVRDTSGVNQGVKEGELALPQGPTDMTAEIPESVQNAVLSKEEKRGRGAKGKGKGAEKGNKATLGGSTKGQAEIAKIREQIKCSSCGTSMVHGGRPLVVPVQGKKIPKNEKGQYRFKSPGADNEGSMVGIICETCATFAAKNETAVANVKSVIAVYPDGQARNIDVKDLIQYEQPK